MRSKSRNRFRDNFKRRHLKQWPNKLELKQITTSTAELVMIHSPGSEELTGSTAMVGMTAFTEGPTEMSFTGAMEMIGYMVVRVTTSSKADQVMTRWSEMLVTMNFLAIVAKM